MSLQIPILLQNDQLVAVDKPPGIPVVPAPPPSEPAGSLRARLESQLGCPLWVVHRLDRDASGVVVFARTAGAHRDLCAAFESRTVQKTYLALTVGVPEPSAGEIEIPLHAARRGKSRPAGPGEAGARAAFTSYSVLSQWRNGDSAVALVEAHPRTGRHHQIRVHFRAIGTPLVGDALYGRRADTASLAEAPCQRLALHASRLVLPAPGLDARLVLEAPLAADLSATLRWLDREWTAEAVHG